MKVILCKVFLIKTLKNESSNGYGFAQAELIEFRLLEP